MIECSKCNDFNAITPPDGGSWEDVVIAANRGCINCSLLVQLVNAASSHFQIVPDGITWSNEQKEKIEACIWSTEENSISTFYDLTLVFREDNTQSCIVPGIVSMKEAEKRNTSSTTSLQKCLDWLSTCTNSHDQCGPGAPTTMPKRVIDVVKCAPDLVLVESLNEPECYVCLSHCWGKKHIISTTSKTFDDHKKRIEIEALPSTFRDAVEFVRKLKLKYLWIDSLCIIQDCASDWNTESKQMASIYKNAFLTIAATKSSHSQGGCFARDTELEITGNNRSRQSYTACFTRPVIHWYPELIDYSSFPLLGRGWVYQERILSPRLLHFGPQELLWECLQQNDCECGAFGTSERPYSKQQYHKPEPLFEGQAGNHWRRKVHEYSVLRLTYGKDKLPALSGLAQEEKHSRPGVPYLAGLWRDTLVWDLMWYPVFMTNRVKGRAPTWSWASVDCQIYFFDISNFDSPAARISTSLCRVLHASCQPKGENDFGEVRSGHLTILGRVNLVKLVSEKSPVLHIYRSRAIIPFRIEKPPVNAVLLDEHSYPDIMRDQETGSILCILQVANMQADWSTPVSTFGEREVEVSLVLKCVNRDLLIFERIGILTCEETLFNNTEEQKVITII